MRFPGFIGPSYTLQSVNVDCQRCVNYYPETDEAGTGKEREVMSLVGTPGLRLLASMGVGPIRGIYTVPSSGALFVVSGSKLYSVDSLFNATLVGSINTNFGNVGMADNGIQLMIVDGLNGYYVTLNTGVLSTITDPNFKGGTQVTFQDGYFILNVPETNQFYLSDLNDVTFTNVDVGTKEGLPDNIIGLMSNQRNLFLFGSLSTEIWWDNGGTFPFQRVEGAFIPIGCMATFSIAKLQDAIYWVGEDQQGRGIVYRTQGYQAQRVSTHAVETALNDIGPSSLAAASAWTYQQGGHGFYVLNFPGSTSSWVFDTSTNLWHERTYLSLGQPGRHRGQNQAFAYSTNVVGDYENGNIYALDPMTYTDNGAPIQRIRTAPHITKELKQNFHSWFQLDMETGIGLDGTGQGTDPKAILQWSDDGGHSWSNEHWMTTGKIGDKRHRAIVRRLGRSRDRVYRITITDPNKTTLIGADLGLQEGTC